MGVFDCVDDTVLVTKTILSVSDITTMHVYVLSNERL